MVHTVPMTGRASHDTAIIEPADRTMIMPREAIKGTRKTLYPATQTRQDKAEARGERAAVKPIYDPTPFPPLN